MRVTVAVWPLLHVHAPSTRCGREEPLLQLVQLEALAPAHSAHVPSHGTHAPASADVANVAVGHAATQVAPRWRCGWGGAQLVQFSAVPAQG